MNRPSILQLVRSEKEWDCVVIGGGSTGLGTALDATTRGLRTLLLEEHDFAKGTSSRSTKLVHGGVRYLRQGHLSLVKDALRERGLLVRNATHLVRPLHFVLPCSRIGEQAFYWTGLKLYDLLARDLSLGPSRSLSRGQIERWMPFLKGSGLRGGVEFLDAQFDDARLAVSLALTIQEHGGVVANYLRVSGLIKKSGTVRGVLAVDKETGEEFHILARVVINATGVYADSVRWMDDANAPACLKLSQGIHFVLETSVLSKEHALILPRTDDRRVLFAIPWNGRVLFGTTDTPVDEVSMEPRPLEAEIDYLLSHAERYFFGCVSRGDVRSVFAGLRPLLHRGGTRGTASLSRDHALLVSDSGLLTVTGGKWTTYRKMAEDTVDRAIRIGEFKCLPCTTADLKLHGWTETVASDTVIEPYGSDSAELGRLLCENPRWTELLHSRLPYKKGEVIWTARHELARTVEDVLARRTRALFLDARAASEAAPCVAQLIAQELGRDESWQQRQVEEFRALAVGYCLD